MPLRSWMLRDFLQAIIRKTRDPGGCWNGWDSYIREMSFTAPQDFIILPMRKGGDGEALRPRCSRSCRETAWRKIWKKAFSGAGRQRRPEPTWRCFREMWSSGYDIPESVEELEHKAVAADGPFVKAFANAARELSMAIGITILEQYPEGPRNTLLLLDRHGECVLSYAKVHTCDFGDECTPDSRERASIRRIWIQRPALCGWEP